MGNFFRVIFYWVFVYGVIVMFIFYRVISYPFNFFWLGLEKINKTIFFKKINLLIRLFVLIKAFLYRYKFAFIDNCYGKAPGKMNLTSVVP
jgi:hypothetical protein